MGERTTHEERYRSIILGLNEKLGDLPEATVFAVPPPAIPGVGITAGVSFLLEDRTGKSVEYLAQHTSTFIDALKDRPEIVRIMTTLISDAPQFFCFC